MCILDFMYTHLAVTNVYCVAQVYVPTNCTYVQWEGIACVCACLTCIFNRCEGGRFCTDSALDEAAIESNGGIFWIPSLLSERNFEKSNLKRTSEWDSADCMAHTDRQPQRVRMQTTNHTGAHTQGWNFFLMLVIVSNFWHHVMMGGRCLWSDIDSTRPSSHDMCFFIRDGGRRAGKLLCIMYITSGADCLPWSVYHVQCYISLCLKKI